MAQTVERVRDAVRRHTTRFERAIPLIASENLLSPYVKELLISDFHSRYAEGLPGERYYEGNEQVDEVETLCLDLAKRLFRCSFADVRPISGTVANLAVLKAMAEPGDLVGTCRLADGAHISSASFGAFGLRGVKPVYYAWDPERMTIDVPRTKEILRAVRPKLALFGLSLFLFPLPVQELSSTLEDIGARGWDDAAHVLGLIAGGEFQDPLHEGCVVISASDPQDAPRPAARDPAREHRRPGSHEAPHVGGVPRRDKQPPPPHDGGARGQPRRTSGVRPRLRPTSDRATRRRWAPRSTSAGFDVLGEKLGFTASHTLAVRVTAKGGGEEVARRLADAGFITNKNLLPGDTSPKHPGGIRLGTPEGDPGRHDREGDGPDRGADGRPVAPGQGARVGGGRRRRLQVRLHRTPLLFRGR